MSSVVFYFHVHQPYRIRRYDLFRIGEHHDYFDSTSDSLDNQKIFQKVALKSYLPTNAILLEHLNNIDDFKVSFSITGVCLEQMQAYAPEVLDSFKQLVNTGKVELVTETYYHSLSCLFSEEEFQQQVRLQHQNLKNIFDVTPTSFRNTELIYNNAIAGTAEKLGYQAILAEGVERYLGWRSPNFIYRPHGNDHIKLLLKNYKLSDDIAFRFSSKSWEHWPLTAEKYAHWVNQVNGNGQVVNLFMDYETFGEHQWESTGIFEFLRQLPYELKKHPDTNFMTVTEAANSYPALDSIDMPELTSWADIERDISAWASNAMQHQALERLYQLELQVKQTGDEELLTIWRRLTTSDHFYYMCTKWFADGDVHKYFSPNNTPYEAYVHFMNVLHDLTQKVYATQSIKESAHGNLHTQALH
jgi:alpha-amylase